MCVYPEEIIRGVKSLTHVSGDNIKADAFQFPNNTCRADGCIEESINWNDDDDAIEFTVYQKRIDGEYRFKGGAAILSRKKVDDIMKLPIGRGYLKYERDKLPDNPYHGNLLVVKDMEKWRRTIIIASLAGCCKYRKRNAYCEGQ